MKYVNIDKETLKSNTSKDLKLELTQKLDNLPFSRWHLFIVICLGYFIDS